MTSLFWMNDALCRESDPETWFPVGTQGPAVEQIKQAKAVCLDCPVKVECLEWSLANAEEFGVWGGMDERERRRLLGRDVKVQQRAVERVAAPAQPRLKPPVVRREDCAVCHTLLTGRQRVYCESRDCKRIAANRQKHFGGSDPWHLVQGTTVLAVQDGAA